jgi:hypothetical protein
MRVRSLLAVTAVCLAVALPASASAPSPQSGAATPRATHLTETSQRHLVHRLLSQGGTTRSKTVTRTVLSGGTSTVVDKRTIKVTVGSLVGLRDRQGVKVTWSGAHPTGAAVTDPNSATAAVQEYPFVLMECRGVDSTKVPRAKRLTPQSCWTQTSSERFTADYNTALPPWRLDRYAATGDRQPIVGRPKGMTGACSSVGLAEHWLPFVNPRGKSYAMGPNGCGGTAPEAIPFSSNLALPGNTTYAATTPNGRGSAIFNVRTADSNASLGCSTQVDCALVVIPIMGISCDADGSGLPPGDTSTPAQLLAAAGTCQRTGNYTPGQMYDPSIRPDQAVTGSLWWSESNWRNRLVFPMTFAPSSATCSITRGGGVQVYGSELLIQATEQWSPVFCLDGKRTPVQHVQTGEPQARNLLKAGTIEAAMGSRAQEGGYGRPVVHAPIAMTGFAVTFQIDGANGRPVKKLNLDARLLAKLLTESYPAVSPVQSAYTALSGNPLNLAHDPEFQALNPGISSSVTTPTAATLLSLSSDSDVMTALTTYINDDPEARAWLDGKPDPWGMVVNPNYKGIALPVPNWPTLDTYEPLDMYKPGLNDCLAQNPVPYLPLVAAPSTRLSLISLAMQFSIAQSQVVCFLPSPIPGNTTGAKLVALGRQAPGFRFMIGVTSVADATRYAVPMAALQTNVAKDAPSLFTSPQGRTFVAPTQTSMKAAAALMRPDKATTNWNLDYDAFHRDAAAAKAYPGTLVVYVDIPTSGLAADDAGAYADWMRYAVTLGQQQGDKVGQLPAGFVPLTERDGMGALRTYTLRAAQAVADQDGTVPPLTAPSVSGRPPGPSGGPGNGGSGGGPYGGPGDTSGTPSDGGGPGSSPTDPSSTPVAASLGATGLLGGGTAGLILPGVLLLAMVAGLAASAVLFRSKLRSGR